VTALIILFKAFEREGQLEHLEQIEGNNKPWRKLCCREFIICSLRVAILGWSNKGK